jgi:peptide/nickel transport system permease protein
MARFILARMLQNVFVLFVLITVMFFLFRLLPGDPIGVMASADLPPEARDALRAAWGLDRPLSVQFADYIGNLLTGDFGLSFAYQQPVWQVLGPKVLNTLVLIVPSTILAVILGCGAGMYLAWYPGRLAERIGSLLPAMIRGVPAFWLGILLLMALSYGTGLFPNGGMRSIGSTAPTGLALYASTDFLWHLTLPLLCLTITSLPEPILIMRSSLLQAAGEDYIELVRAKGMPERVVLMHAARNSLLPVATWVFHMFGYAIASTVLVEVVFAWPGLGREIVSAVTTFDYPVSQAAFFLIAVITIGTNFLLDLLYGTLDPRVVASG